MVTDLDMCGVCSVAGDPNQMVETEGGGNVSLSASAIGGGVGLERHFGKKFVPNDHRVQRMVIPAKYKNPQKPVLLQSDKVYVTVLNEQGILIGDLNVQVERGWKMILFCK